MSNYALIKNGIVENIVLADADFINSLPNKNDYVQYTNAGIGWSYDGVNFIPPKCHTEAVLNAKSAKWECTNTDHDIKEIPLA